MNDTFHSTLSSISTRTSSWSKKCLQLPGDIDIDIPVKLVFKVIHGGVRHGYIAVDDINLSTEECPSTYLFYICQDSNKLLTCKHHVPLIVV